MFDLTSINAYITSFLAIIKDYLNWQTGLYAAGFVAMLIAGMMTKRG